MAIDRSKFKKTSASQLAQADKELNQTLGRKEKLGNGHEIEEGANLFRLYPAHPVEDGGIENAPFVQPFVQVYVPSMVQERDSNGKPIMEGGKPKMKQGNKVVWNAKVHGGKPKDLLEEYITLAGKKAKSLGLADDAYKKFMLPIYGSYNKANPKASIQGIYYKLQWVMYADKYPNANPAANPIFDELKIGKGIKERLNKIAAIETSNDPLGTDPFTDLEEGKAIKIFKDKENDNPNLIYTTDLDNSTVNEVHAGKTFKVQKTYPLSDTQIDYFLKQTPLCVKYGKKLATRKNFETQLAALETIDEKYNMGIFDMPEWGDIVLEIDNYYPENDAPEATGNDDAGSNETEQQEETGSNEDQYDVMDRKELTAYARRLKTGIVVLPSMKDDDIRTALRKWDADTEIPNEALPGEEVAETEIGETTALDGKFGAKEEVKDDFLSEMNKPVDKLPAESFEKKSETPVAQMSAKDKLAAMRARKAS